MYYDLSNISCVNKTYVKLQHMDNQNGQHKATSLCTQTDDPITNDRCIHRACSYSRAHLPGNGMVRYTPYKSNVLCMSSRCQQTVTGIHFIWLSLVPVTPLQMIMTASYLGVRSLYSYVLATMTWCIFCVYHFASACVNMHTHIIPTQEEMEFGKVFL